MRKGQDSKVKVAGRASCLGLLALGIAIANPVNPSVYAEEIGDYGVVDTQALTASTVGISFSPAKYYAGLSPTDGAGQSARIDLQTTIYVANSGGYGVYLKSNNPNLVGEKDSRNFIPGATTAKSYEEMDVNTWGYAWANDATTVPNTATYGAVSASGNGDKLAENTDSDIELDTRTIALSFATKINNEMPADTYSNTMTLSVVSSPKETASWDEITTMQEMTARACANAGIGATKQLRDVRDGKYSWISKLADGKCWMTQNLDLDLSTEVALTPEDSDVKTNWVPKYDTATEIVINSSNPAEYPIGAEETKSWSFGDVRVAKPGLSNYCGINKISASECPDQFIAYNTPTTANKEEEAHYILGNFYQRNAATAGADGLYANEGSICARGWTLPNFGDDGFNGLLNAYSFSERPNTLAESPMYITRGGFIDSLYLFSHAGAVADYWSLGTGNSNFDVWLNSDMYPSGSWILSNGLSVRCVAR